MPRLSQHYLFGGLAIDSAITLDGARRVGADCPGHRVTLDFHQGLAPPADHDVYSWTGRYALKLGRHGDGWHFSSVFDGSIITDAAISRLEIYGPGDTPDAGLMDVLTRRVLPRLAIETGALTIHGAALIRDGGAILLLGRSGAGKSTLTAALALAGWSIASDDMTMIRSDGSGPMVHPGSTGVCLWRDTRESLNLDPARCRTMPGYDDKLRFEPEDAPPANPAPLRAIVYLERGEVAAPELAAMQIRDAVRRATQQLIAFDPTAPRTAAATLLVRAMSQVPLVKLSYPSGYASLPGVMELLASPL